MALLKIARMGHPVLLARAAVVEDPLAPDIQDLIADMIETMHDANGAGLAAPQVHRSLRLFVYHVPVSREPSAPLSVRALINPEITPIDDAIMLCEEGCLSIPGLRATVPRHERVHYRGLDQNGVPVEGEASGFHANVLQHEADHLDGVLYPMRIVDHTRFGFSEELLRYPPSVPREGDAP
jgi:peptide deformylase